VYNGECKWKLWSVDNTLQHYNSRCAGLVNIVLDTKNQTDPSFIQFVLYIQSEKKVNNMIKYLCDIVYYYVQYLTILLFVPGDKLELISPRSLYSVVDRRRMRFLFSASTIISYRETSPIIPTIILYKYIWRDDLHIWSEQWHSIGKVRSRTASLNWSSVTVGILTWV